MARRRHRILCGWKHAEGTWQHAQRRAILRRVLSKWLTLDLRYYLALGGAWLRRGEARAARAREQQEGTRSLLEVFEQIAATWPPGQIE